MKIALIADVHGNLPALEAVLRHARGLGAAEMILNLGDLTGYGPFPDRVVRWSRAPHIINILGDYDKKVIDNQQHKAGWKNVKNSDKRDMFAWTYDAISKHSRKFLQSLPEKRTIETEGVKILLTHGSPAAHREYLGLDTPLERLVELTAISDASVVLSGHSHQAFTRQANGVLFINPGTIGRPDDGDPRASYAILEIKAGKVNSQHYRVPYDIMANVRALRMAGLPEVFTQIIRLGLNYDAVVGVMGDSPIALEPEPSGTVTLLTDFNLMDHYVGVMKGVIKEIAPHTTLIDISHQVHPHSIVEGAHLLAQSVPYFATGTVHIAVVDPGVGTSRCGLAAHIGSHLFVAPDNGLLTLVLEKAQKQGEPVQLISLTNHKYWLPYISNTFHGRDIFAPVGAHLVNGVPITNLGEAIDNPVILSLAQPQSTPKGWQAEVVLVDGFGNIYTNLLGTALPEDKQTITVKIGTETIHGLTRSFGDAGPGTLIATVGSSGCLAIAEVNGNAADRLQIHIGAPVLINVRNKPIALTYRLW